LTRPDFENQPAGIVTRALAAVIDMVVVLLLLGGLWAAVAAVVFLAKPSRFAVPSPPWSAVGSIAGVLAVLYLAVAWATTGRTVGAQVMGLRVRSRHGARLGWLRSIARAVAYVIFPLGLAWTIVDRHNRSVQDLIVASGVVYDWLPRSPRRPVGSPSSGDEDVAPGVA
jgi:uncharacterized RDD family membrane protein YckC